MAEKILFCTVGGSHQPIITAIEQIQPNFVYFLCTTGPAGSDMQINGRGLVIKAKFTDKKPTLPNIPLQIGLSPEQFKIVTIEPDDLDESFNIIMETMREAQKQYPSSDMIADYTGGTKGMTVALVLASLEKNIKLHLVTGNRADLVKVTDGTQLGLPVNYESIRLRREMALHLASWRRYAYGQAMVGLQNMVPPINSALQQQYLQARNLSKAFDLWDRFDHLQARHVLKSYCKTLGKTYAHYYIVLDILTKDSKIKEPALIYDLWLNALRRAAQGRYDDAVSRVYRVFEWAAQWILRVSCQVDTSNIPPDFIPTGITILKNRQNKYQAPLYQAWQLLASKTDGALAVFFQKHGNDLLEKLNLRNSSILAHGFQPIDQDSWNKLQKWMLDKFWPYFENDAKTTGLTKLPVQLPECYNLRLMIF